MTKCLALVEVAALLGASAVGAQEPPARAPVAITVLARQVLVDRAWNPLGINMDALTDDDANRPVSPVRSLAEALREMNVKLLRYPGGWKSDALLWSRPPFERSALSLARHGPGLWPAKDRALFHADGTWAANPYEFDELMETCQAIGAEPTLVVPYNSLYWPRADGVRAPTRQLLVDTAAAWVRYANVTKGYRVRYWEIGNETYLKESDVKMDREKPTGPEGEYAAFAGISAETYARDVVEFSRAMKAVDPGIRIGVNGKGRAWWETVFAIAGAHVDFCSVHSYPMYGTSRYEEYSRGPRREAHEPLREAIAASHVLPTADRKRLRYLLTEFGAGSFGPFDRTGGDGGRALMTFDLLGMFLTEPRLDHVAFWTTINVYDRPHDSVFCALREDNGLTGIGRALAVWGRFLGRSLVETRHPERLPVYATLTPQERLTLFVVNRDTAPEDVLVEVQGLSGLPAQAERWGLSTPSPDSKDVSWGPDGSVPVRRSRIRATLRPLSVSVFDLPLTSLRSRATP